MDASLTLPLTRFEIDGELLEVHPTGSGHINDTYLSRWKSPPGETYYIHQRINHHIFRQPEQLMENVDRVTRHIRQQVIARGGDPQRECLTLVPTREGKIYLRTSDGDYWRTYQHIAGARTYDQAEDLRHITSAARAFGNFQAMLSHLPGERLYETIPFFHHTPRRFEAFQTALREDAASRASLVQPEIDFILQRGGQTAVVVTLLESGEIPERVTHNDTKLNNVLIDEQSGEGICVIDLDTVMPGSALYDFGDMVRVSACTAVEDEPDLEKVHFDPGMFRLLAAGYLSTAGSFLNRAEIAHLAFSARLITLEQGMRFLGDYLNGDVYYKIHRPQHNLERCRTQLRMVAEMEDRVGEMQAMIEACLPR